VQDIAVIHRAVPEVELEVFVHGALCIAYSGQCLTSEALGGRSANRGACAQACRLPYDLVVDGAVKDLGDLAYLLSPEDLEASALVPGLLEAGVVSLKIEGRLKGPDYVAATTRLYRSAIDAALTGASDGVDEETRLQALQAFSRGSGPGFLAGVDHLRLVEGRACDHRGLEVGLCGGVVRERGRDLLVVQQGVPIARGDGLLVEGGRAGEGEVGGRVWDVEGDRVWLGPDVDVRAAQAGRRVWRTSDPARERAVLTRLEQSPHAVAVDLRIEGEIGQAPTLRAQSERGGSAEVRCDTALTRAERHPLDEARLRAQLGRLGDTPFVLRDLEVALPPDAMLPVSSLNRARRAVVEALLKDLHRPHPVQETETGSWLADAARWRDAADRPDRTAPAMSEGLFVLCRTLPQALAAIAAGADGVTLDFLELTGTGEAVRRLRAQHPGVPLTLAPPRIRKPGEEKIDRFLRGLSPDALLVRGLGALHESSGADDGIARIGDFSLNITNRISAAEALGRGLAAFTPSFDLDAAQLLALLEGPLAQRAEVVLHHPMPLFHMEHCVIAAHLGTGKDYRTCGRPCEHHQLALRDRAGMDHPIEADVGCRNTVFHARAQSAADLVPRLRERGVRRFRIELVREGETEVTRLVASYRALLEGRVGPKETRAALRTEGGYGVVKGSLRVLQG
jgi:putative protease